MTSPGGAPLVMRCMQVFGGNRTVEQRFELPAIQAYLSSVAFGGVRGGDIHYVSTCGHGEIVRFVIADVAGHGAEVADVAARFRTLLTRNINRLDQSRLVRALNAEFVKDNEDGRFVTMLFASYHRPSGHLVICNAGHPRPLLYRARSRQWQFLDYRVEERSDELLNLPLGIIHPTNYYQFAVRVFPGDVVVLYTDGLSDVRTRAGRSGEARMLETVNGVVPGNLEAFATEVRAALGLDDELHTLEDDETLLVIAPSEHPFAPLTLAERFQALGKMIGVIAVD